MQEATQSYNEFLEMQQYQEVFYTKNITQDKVIFLLNPLNQKEATDLKVVNAILSDEDFLEARANDEEIEIL